MVEVKYVGRLGNMLFSYCFGRILAEELGFELKAKGIEGFPNTFQPIHGKHYEYPEVTYYKKDLPDLEKIILNKAPRKITVNAWVQQYKYYKKYKNHIRNEWLTTEPVNFEHTPGPDDIVVVIRLGDYIWVRWALSPSYYLACIEKHIAKKPHGKIFILTDDFDSPLLEPYNIYKPIYIKEDYMYHLKFMMAAQTIIISQSTFSWWGAFLSNATKIYFPLPANRSLWGKESHADLRVDEPRYEYIHNVTLLHEDLKYKDFDKNYTIIYITLFGKKSKNILKLPSITKKPYTHYVCFTDSYDIRSTFWEIRKVKRKFWVSTKKLEHTYREMPFLFLSKYKKSIWVEIDIPRTKGFPFIDGVFGRIGTHMRRLLPKVYKAIENSRLFLTITKITRAH